MRNLSIFSLCWHGLALICCIGFADSDPSASLGWGMLSALFGIGASIGFINNFKRKPDLLTELYRLKVALDSGAISKEAYELKTLELSK